MGATGREWRNLEPFFVSCRLDPKFSVERLAEAWLRGPGIFGEGTPSARTRRPEESETWVLLCQKLPCPLKGTMIAHVGMGCIWKKQTHGDSSRSVFDFGASASLKGQSFVCGSWSPAESDY